MRRLASVLLQAIIMFGCVSSSSYLKANEGGGSSSAEGGGVGCKLIGTRTDVSTPNYARLVTTPDGQEKTLRVFQDRGAFESSPAAPVGTLACQNMTGGQGQSGAEVHCEGGEFDIAEWTPATAVFESRILNSLVIGVLSFKYQGASFQDIVVQCHPSY